MGAEEYHYQVKEIVNDGKINTVRRDKLSRESGLFQHLCAKWHDILHIGNWGFKMAFLKF